MDQRMRKTVAGAMDPRNGSSFTISSVASSLRRIS